MTLARLRSGDEALALKAVRRVHGRYQADLARLRVFLRKPENVLLVACENGDPVGSLTAYMLRRPHRAQPQCLLYEIDVVQEHRREGVGTALVEALIGLAVQECAYEIWVLTECDEDPAPHALYTACGFRTTPSTDRLYTLALPISPHPVS